VLWLGWFPFGGATCYLISFIQPVAVYSSSFTLVLISFERSLFICLFCFYRIFESYCINFHVGTWRYFILWDKGSRQGSLIFMTPVDTYFTWKHCCKNVNTALIMWTMFSIPRIVSSKTGTKDNHRLHLGLQLSLRHPRCSACQVSPVKRDSLGVGTQLTPCMRYIVHSKTEERMTRSIVIYKPWESLYSFSTV
jgi:hypothetical protein